MSYSISDDYNQFKRLGHPGRYYKVFTYTGDQVDFTGSNYGYGAMYVAAHGGATASLSDGGTIKCDKLPATINELSVSKLEGGTNSLIYVFKRQQ